MKSQLILPENVVSFMKKFTDANFQIFVVGGAVRDLLLGKKTDNWDFTTNAKPEEIQKLFPDSFYNNDYGTVSVPVETQNIASLPKKNIIFEITPFRTEGTYSDLRHPDKIEWGKTIEDDLSRRDFTINAIAYDGSKLIDPYEGEKDLEAKVVRAVGDPDKRFSEDALRLMRAVRIATQLQFLLEEKTRKSAIKNAHLLQKISRERIRDELFKILSSGHPADGILFLHNTGLLKYIIPEMEEAFETPQKSPKRHHIYDVGTHLVMALKNVTSQDVIVRLATLLHDIGKPKTFKKDPQTQLITFYNHEIVGAQIVKRIADDLRLSNSQKDKLYHLVRYHQFTVSELQTDKAVRRFIREVGKENVEDMLVLRHADRVGSGSKLTSWRTELFKKRLIEVQKEPFAIKDLKIDGHDVMRELNLKPGPKIGEILQKLFAEVVEKKLPNERDILLKELQEYKSV